MSYVEQLTLRELAVHYANYKDLTCLDELEKRDKVSQMTFDEVMAMNEDVEGQMLFEFKESNPVLKEEKPILLNTDYVRGFEEGYRKAIEDSDVVDFDTNFDRKDLL